MNLALFRIGKIVIELCFFFKNVIQVCGISSISIKKSYTHSEIIHL